MAVKRPAFQFYPLEWLGDLELQSCSIAARGMWVDMLCLAHHPDRYGHLTINGKAMTDAQIVNNIRGASRKLLTELEQANVFSRAADGAIYSRRMVRDEELRQFRAEFGHLGAEHGEKGREFGHLGGDPRKFKGGQSPPLTMVATGGKDPPLQPPPAFAVASAVASASIPTRSSGVTPADSAPAKSAQGDWKNIEESKAKTNGAGQNWNSMAYVHATAITVDRPRRQGESDEDWTDAVRSEVELRMREAKAERGRRKA